MNKIKHRRIRRWACRLHRLENARCHGPQSPRRPSPWSPTTATSQDSQEANSMRPSARAHAAIPRYAHDDRHASGSLQGSSRGPTISMKWASILIDRRARTVRRDPNPPPPPPSQGCPHTASPRRGDATQNAKPSHMQSRASRNPDLCDGICTRPSRKPFRTV